MNTEKQPNPEQLLTPEEMYWGVCLAYHGRAERPMNVQDALRTLREAIKAAPKRGILRDSIAAMSQTIIHGKPVSRDALLNRLPMRRL